MSRTTKYRRERTCPVCGRVHYSEQNKCHSCKWRGAHAAPGMLAKEYRAISECRAAVGLRPVDRQGRVAPWLVVEPPRTMAEAERGRR